MPASGGVESRCRQALSSSASARKLDKGEVSGSFNSSDFQNVLVFWTVPDSVLEYSGLVLERSVMVLEWFWKVSRTFCCYRSFLECSVVLESSVVLWSSRVL